MARLAFAWICLGAILGTAGPAAAADDEPIVWPTVRYGWPEKISAGIAIQPPFSGVWSRLIASVTAGTGGVKAGVGVGSFGDNLMHGYGLHVTLLRTTANPHGALPHQTFVGVEGQVMLCNISVKIGPALRVSGDRHSGDRVRVNASIGLGF